MESKIIKIGIIGCGRVAERIYLPALKKFHNIKITAVMDPIAERRNLISAALTGCMPFESFNENLLDHIDAGIITAPVDAHLSLAAEFLKKNKYVLVEKPLAESMEGIKELREIESASNAFLMMGFNHRYWIPVSKLKERLSLRDEIDFSEIIFSSDYSKWDPISYISDPLDDLGPHVFDLIGYIFDKKIISVSAGKPDKNKFDFKVNVEKNIKVQCRVEHCNETIREINIKSKAENYFITLKSVRIFPQSGFVRDILDINDRLKTKLLRKEFPINISYEVQLEKFFNFMKLGKIPKPGIDEGISAICAIESTRKSINNKGKEIYLDEFKS